MAYEAFQPSSREQEQIDAERRRFATFDPSRLPQRTSMVDLQQVLARASLVEELPLVMPGASTRASVLVERPELPDLDAFRTSVAQPDPATTAALEPDVDPAEVARQVVADARSTARSMLAQARAVIESEREQARQRGFEEGHARGLAEADTEAAGLIATCERIGLEVAAERERALVEHEPDLVDLALAIARRIVNASIEVDEMLVVDACRGAMRKAFQRESLQVLACREDLAVLRDAGPRLAAELGGVEHLDFVEERRLERGSVVVRTPAGEIDATIEGKASRIELALREGIEQRRAERRAQQASDDG